MSKYENAEAYMLQLAIKRAEAEKEKLKRAELFREARAKGMTYEQIGEQYGVSTSSAAKVCGKDGDARFRAWTSERCIYINIRNWMNENRVSLSDMVRIAEGQLTEASRNRYSTYMRGGIFPQKRTIDRWIAITGLTYEQLWEVDAK